MVKKGKIPILTTERSRRQDGHMITELWGLKYWALTISIKVVFDYIEQHTLADVRRACLFCSDTSVLLSRIGAEKSDLHGCKYSLEIDVNAAYKL